MVALKIVLAEIHRQIITYYMPIQSHNLICSPCWPNKKSMPVNISAHSEDMTKMVSDIDTST